MTNKQIDKIKYNLKEKEVVIEYSLLIESPGGGVDEVSFKLKSYDDPLAEFVVTFGSLTSDVERICSLPVGYCLSAEIRGVSFNYRNEMMGATITALVPVETANSPVVINTPFLPSGQYNEGGEAPVLPTATRLKLEQLIIYANDYIDGKRQPSAQLSMDL